MTIQAPPGRAAELLRRKSRALRRELLRAERRVLRQGLLFARQLSQGSYNLAQLRRMGHPYAKAAPSPPGDPARINRQSGLFLKAWEVEEPEERGGSLTGRVVNRHAHGLFLQGGPRSTMIPRPIVARVRERLAALRLKALAAAARSGLSSR